MSDKQNPTGSDTDESDLGCLVSENFWSVRLTQLTQRTCPVWMEISPLKNNSGVAIVFHPSSKFTGRPRTIKFSCGNTYQPKTFKGIFLSHKQDLPCFPLSGEPDLNCFSPRAVLINVVSRRAHRKLCPNPYVAEARSIYNCHRSTIFAFMLSQNAKVLCWSASAPFISPTV